MKKLELRHLAGYLPYGLRLRTIIKPAFRNRDNIVEFTTWNLNDISLPLTKRYSMKECKPILRPLSDLTKEIEHNGRNFIPIREIYRLQEWDWDESDDETILEIYSDEDLIPFSHAQKLFEWHFDVYSLIDHNLAIPITKI